MATSEDRTRFEVLLEDMQRDVRVMAEAILANTEAIQLLRADVEQRFEAVDRRFMLLEVRIDQKLEALEGRIDRKMDRKLEALEVRIDQKLEALEGRLTAELVRITTHLGIEGPPRARHRTSS